MLWFMWQFDWQSFMIKWLQVQILGSDVDWSMFPFILNWESVILWIRDPILISVGQTLDAQRVWLSSEEKNLLLQMLVILDVCYQGKARYFHLPFQFWDLL